MLQIKFTRKNTDPSTLFDEILADVKVDNAQIKKQVLALGALTTTMMLAIIVANKKRPQNGEELSLENHIKTEFFEGGWGVGAIEELKENAPYWAAVNWGSSHMVGKRVPNGAFSPVKEQPDQAFFRQDRWVKGKGHYSYVVKRPIPAMNYIEKTIFWLSDAIIKMSPSIPK